MLPLPVYRPRPSAVPRTVRRPRLTPRVLAALIVLGLPACGPSQPDGVIDRQVFIDTYVELRIAALQTDSQRVAAADRERILGEHAVTQADLEGFVEAYATDLDFLRDVWNDVESRLNQPPDGTGSN